MSKNKILCVIDAQNDFIDGALGTKEAAETISYIAPLVKNWAGVIITTQDTHDAKKYSATKEGKLLPVSHCVKGTVGWEINSEIQKVLDEALVYPSVEKSTFGDFGVVDTIKKHCKMFGVDENNLDITFVGFCTDICVISNAIIVKTAFPEANISIDVKGCAGTSPSAHKAALVAMKSCQINIQM